MFNWYTGGGSSSARPDTSGSKRIAVDARQVKSSLYELWKPSGSASMEILFFHGLYMGDSSKPYLSTWESEDGSCNWPQKWLAREFPSARLLAVSYNACIGKRSDGNLDLYLIGENLLFDLRDENIGQTPDCPVILVGHSFGGLVIKEVCLRANRNINLSRFQSDKGKVKTFLNNLKGVFFYGTPHHGSLCMDRFTSNMDNLLLDYFKALNVEASRLDFEFEQLCKVYTSWRISGLGESLPDQSGPFPGVAVASEGAARKGDHFNMVVANHLLICKPRDQTDRRFYALKSLLLNIVNEVEVIVHQCQGLPNYPIKLESHALELQSKLTNGGVLGIFGMGGIGKTTLAKQVFNSISKDFEYTCFVNDVKRIPSYELEERILKGFHVNGRFHENQTQWVHLREKRTLIVMDDVDSQVHLEVLPKLDHLGNGSSVIITSRDKHVFTVYESYITYEVDFLESDDATRLLCQHAFGLEDIPELLTKEVHALVEKCAGLPLTLEVMGRYLREHKTNATIWRETIGKLGKALAIDGGQNDRVWASLKVSYDALLQDQQKMFGEAALIFFHQPLHRALAAWTNLSENAETTWASLVSRSLVKEYPTFSHVNLRFGVNVDQKVVWVHEQLRDLAKNITDIHMVSEADDRANLLVAELNTKKVKVMTQSLTLSYPSLSHRSRTPLQVESLAELKRLKYLELKGDNHMGRGNGLTSKLSLLKCDGGSHRPRRPRLPCVPLGNEKRLSKFTISLRKMDQLAVLELGDFVVSKGFPETLGNLTNLRVLSLRHLEGFDRLPENFSNLSRLRRLELEDLSILIVPDSFGNLLGLEYLSFVSITSLELPESFGKLSSLVKLVIHDCKGLAGLPDSFDRHRTSLEDLIISSCPLIKRLPHCFSQLSRLQRLHIVDCCGLKELGDTFGNLSSLQELHLYNLALQSLPGSFGLLTMLEELYIFECADLEELGNAFGNLSSLRVLRLEGVAVQRLPASFGLLTRLEKLHISWAKNLRSLSDNFGQLISLKDLFIFADELEMLPDSFYLLKSLLKLKIYCTKLKRLPDNFAKLSSIEDLEISARSLESLPESIGQLHVLKTLSVWLGSAVSLPEVIRQLSTLRTVKVACHGHEWRPNLFEHLWFSVPDLR